MKPLVHAQSSAKRFGGTPEDYIHIHEWFDQTKGQIADNRHRALLHTSFGIMLSTQVFGETFERKSDGKKISTRDIGEQHVLEDNAMKFIPTVQDYLEHMSMEPWMENGKNGVPSSCAKLSRLSENKETATRQRTIILGD